VLAFFTLVPTALVTYLATWLPWFLNPTSYMRTWAADLAPDEQVRSWLPHGLNSLWQYHLNMWEFHTTLTSEHTYMSNPFGWLVQFLPPSFGWQTVHGPADETLCGSDSCAAAILAVGNPVLWWGGATALLALGWGMVKRDRRAWAIFAGYLAGYVPWFAYSNRTIFTFYTVAFVPFVALALT